MAGLISSIQLIRAGLSCTVIEKKSYPFHRVCGEYISNEALPFLTASGLYPTDLDLPQIKMFEFSSVGGRAFRMPLDLGGFGVSRYTFDNHLYHIARAEGVRFFLNTEVTEINFKDDQFEIRSGSENFNSDVVIGAFGKRSKIDVQQNRDFIKHRSPYVGIKYHARTGQPDDLISLHNFPGGYCGVCRVDQGLTNLCYITHRDNLREFGDVRTMEEAVLFRNPLIRGIFSEAELIFEKPEVINEVSFATKAPVENHVLMAGDAAGMITPACGNGMAIAIHSGKIVAGLIEGFCNGHISRATLEAQYRLAWNNQFRTRLWVGRRIQGLFGSSAFSSAAVSLARFSSPLAHLIMRKTHGQPF